MRGRSMRPEGAENARRRASRPKAPPPAQGPPSLGYGSCPGMESSGAPARPPPGPSHTRWKSRPARPPARRDSHSSHSRGDGGEEGRIALNLVSTRAGEVQDEVIPTGDEAAPPRDEAIPLGANAAPAGTEAALVGASLPRSGAKAPPLRSSAALTLAVCDLAVLIACPAGGREHAGRT